MILAKAPLIVTKQVLSLNVIVYAVTYDVFKNLSWNTQERYWPEVTHISGC